MVIPREIISPRLEFPRISEVVVKTAKKVVSKKRDKIRIPVGGTK